MKKLSFSRLLWLFVLAPGGLVAADQSMKAVSVGEVSLLIGSVVATDGQGAKRTLNRGAFVYEKDMIETAAGGHAHLHFVDDAVISLRPNSRLRIDSYVYNIGNPDKNSIRLNLDSGVLRSLSGKASQDAHDRFRLNTPIAAVGVLGTDFIVRSESERMWAAVYSGAIAVAPFDKQGCHSGGLGACSNALRLSAKMGDLMFVYDGQKGINHVIKRDQHLPRKESALQSDQQGRQGLHNDSSQQVGSATSMNAAKVVQGRKVSSIEASPFAFGRWHGDAWNGDQISEPFKQASAGRKVTVGSPSYAVFRKPIASMNISWGQPVQFDFKLTNGNVHFLENTPSWVAPKVSAAVLGNSFLHINLADQSVSTRVEMSHAQTGPVHLNVRGTINNQGLFSAHGDNGMAAGALSAEGGHAAMLFEKKVDRGVFHGISSWNR
ncbi:MAG: FecR domain-containing protein [Gammaproteobacteria bacterium]|nr:FecR domain-containing protein [Gammaproteobacteria bacterium]